LQKDIPVMVMPDVIRVSTGSGGNTCAVAQGGDISCWGNDAFRQLGFGAGAGASGYSRGKVILGAGGVDISAGVTSGCALTQDAAIWCWGTGIGNGKGISEGGFPPTQVLEADTAAEVSAGQDGQTCVRKLDGTLWCWGYNADGEVGDGSKSEKVVPIQISPLGMRVAHVSAGEAHTCALEQDGTLWCWGSNATGQLGDGTTTDSASPLQVLLPCE
jgi:alpha-tubulin suppressor-like RCC1 family protein